MSSPELERYLRLAMGDGAYEMAVQQRQRSAKRQERERRRTVNQALGHPAKKRGEPHLTADYRDFEGNPLAKGDTVNYAGMSYAFEIVGFRPEGVAIIRSLDPGHGHGYTSTVPLRCLVKKAVRTDAAVSSSKQDTMVRLGGQLLAVDKLIEQYRPKVTRRSGGTA